MSGQGRYSRSRREPRAGVGCGNNSWVDATGDIAAAVRADRRGVAILTGAYIVAAALMLVLTLT